MQPHKLSVTSSHQATGVPDNSCCPPYCFYHPEKLITHFCLHSSCILPLCQECVAIHRRQTIGSESSAQRQQCAQSIGKHTSKIMPYNQVKKVALQSIADELVETNNASSQMIGKLEIFVRQLNECMKTQIEYIRNQLLLRYRFCEKRQEFESNIKAINEGSLKQLIRHYEQGNVFLPAANPVQFEINSVMIRNTLWSMISNQKVSGSREVTMKYSESDMDEDEMTVGDQQQICNPSNCHKSKRSCRKLVRRNIFSADFHKNKDIQVASPSKEHKNPKTTTHKYNGSMGSFVQQSWQHRSSVKEISRSNSQKNFKICASNVSCSNKVPQQAKAADIVSAGKKTDELAMISNVNCKVVESVSVAKLSIPFVEIKPQRTVKRSDDVQVDQSWRQFINYSDVHARNDDQAANLSKTDRKLCKSSSRQHLQVSQSQHNQTGPNTNKTTTLLNKSIDNAFNDTQILNPQQMRELMLKRRQKAQQISYGKNCNFSHSKENQITTILSRKQTFHP